VFLSHLASPFNRRGNDIVKYSNSLKVHVITAEFDILRDEGESYAMYMKENGADVTSKRLFIDIKYLSLSLSY
jgi:acetyl esterase/lipase